MKLHNILKKGAMALIAVITFTVSSPSIHANLQGRWIQHPAAALRSADKESQVDRIIEGNRYVYFSVRGAYFNRGESTTYTTMNNIDPLQIFRYDKSLVWSDDNLRPLAQEFELSGNLPVVMNYSSESSVFVVIYDNNNMDFIFDEGTIIYSKALNGLISNGVSIRPYSITFDDERSLIYIAGSFGFATVDLRNGELNDLVLLDKEVAWAGRIGKQIVVFAGSVSPSTYNTYAYSFPEEKIPLRIGDLSPLPDSANLQYLMPVSSSSFAALAQNENSQTTKILKQYDIETLTNQVLSSDLVVDNSSTYNFRHMFSTDGYVQNAKNGFVINSRDKIVILEKQGNQNISFSEIIKPSHLSINEKLSKSATIDGKKIWLYTYETNGISDISKRGFYTYELGKENWFNKSEVAAPSAPVSIFLSYGEWNPEHGLLLRGPGCQFEQNESDIDRLCLLNEGRWTDLTYAQNNPKYVEPTKSAKYARFDPVNPNWIWGNSCKYGLHRINIDDYNDFFELGIKNLPNYEVSYPGFFAVIEPLKVWNIIVNLTNVDFDSNNTMWFAQWNQDLCFTDEDDIINSEIPLYYVTAEERAELINGMQDKSFWSNIINRKISIPFNRMYIDSRIIALKYEGNQNLIVGSPNTYSSSHSKFFVYDHNGTLNDTSDDRYADSNILYDENGERISYQIECGIYEDENNGNVWLLTSSGCFIIDPQEFIKGNKNCKRLKISQGIEKGINGNPFEFVSIKAVDKDIFGRKWLASNNGLYCLSSDTKELLGHYTADNSPLPSNDLFNVICNPENGIIYVLTPRGMVEFHPEGNSNNILADKISIYPSLIRPDYKGMINFSGVTNDKEYLIKSEDGSVVYYLGMPESGLIQWDMRDSEGVKVKAGKYFFVAKDDKNPQVITIL